MTADVLLHGGALDLMRARFPEAPTPWIDLSTGINPWPYQTARIGNSALQHLPTAADVDSCRQAMAAAIGAPPPQLLLAPGSELLIRLLPGILPVSCVCVASESYGDHAKAWRNSGAELIEATDPLQHLQQADALVLCNPNNPDGRSWPPERLLAARQTLAARGGWLIVDEAYADLEPQHSMASFGGQQGLVVFRSFG